MADTIHELKDEITQAFCIIDEDTLNDVYQKHGKSLMLFTERKRWIVQLSDKPEKDVSVVKNLQQQTSQWKVRVPILAC